jgi:Raf kinase inhibitor-like YbhB/YbcL family protein
MVVPILATATLLLSVSCGDDEDPAPPSDAPAEITVTSQDFSDGQQIPSEFTCDGDETSPSLAWSGVPKDARALALVVDDPDAPSGTFTHWVVIDFAPDRDSIAAGESPAGGIEISNSSGEPSYAGPCPPSGTHHYRFTLYAMSDPTGLDGGASLDDAFAAIEAKAIAMGRLIGTYQRQ